MKKYLFCLSLFSALLPLPAHAQKSYTLECNMISMGNAGVSRMTIQIKIDENLKRGEIIPKNGNAIVLNLKKVEHIIMLSGRTVQPKALFAHMATIAPKEEIYHISMDQHAIVDIEGAPIKAPIMMSEQGSCSKSAKAAE